MAGELAICHIYAWHIMFALCVYSCRYLNFYNVKDFCINIALYLANYIIINKKTVIHVTLLMLALNFKFYATAMP